MKERGDDFVVGFWNESLPTTYHGIYFTLFRIKFSLKKDRGVDHANARVLTTNL